MVLTVDGLDGTMCYLHNLWDLVLVILYYWHRTRIY